MHLPRYKLQTDDFVIFSFTSEGPKGNIQKIVQFSSLGQNQVYNLSLCDKDPLTGELNDKVVTDNGDTEMVLATIVAAVYSFCSHYPAAWVYATGSTLARTRLYRMGINKYYEIVVTDFKIFGETKDSWEPYRKNEHYDSFLVQRKLLNLRYEEYKGS